MTKFKQEQDDGTFIEVDGFTQEEVDAKLEEKKVSVSAEYDLKIEENTKGMATLASEKAQLESDLAAAKAGDGGKENGGNFKILKDALDKKDADINGLRETIESDKKTAAADAMTKKINLASGNNTELAKKIKLNLDTILTGMPETNEAEKNAKFSAALKLSVDTHSEIPGMFDQGLGGGGGGGYNPIGEGSNTEFTSKEKSLGGKMGISAEDYKKYGSRVINKKPQ